MIMKIVADKQKDNAVVSAGQHVSVSRRIKKMNENAEHVAYIQTIRYIWQVYMLFCSCELYHLPLVLCNVCSSFLRFNHRRDTLASFTGQSDKSVVET